MGTCETAMSEMEGRICLITGANSGIGKETAIGLAKKGAQIVMAVRNLERGEKARTDIIEKSGKKAVDLLRCDVSLMSNIRQFAKEFDAKYPKLDVLINNAGAVFNKRSMTDEGFERTLAVDYLGPVLLTHELLPTLRKVGPSMIVNVSSGLHKNASINLSDMQSEKSYDGMKVYSKAKLMLMMFTYELARRLEATGITVNAVMPGFVATNLGKNSDSLLSSIMFRMVRPMQISAEEGAATSIYVCSSGEAKGKTGKCYEKGKEVNSSPLSYDRDLQSKLWVKTNELLGISPDW
jgi:NAD(P)-dependent dehydrogenase (short-subunit alcohol dehydrogenase family)